MIFNLKAEVTFIWLQKNYLQASRSSLAFDILLPGETDGTVGYHKPIAPPKSFKPVSLSLPGLVEPQKHLCELCIFSYRLLIDNVFWKCTKLA